MATKPVGKILFEALTEDEDVEEILGADVYPDGAVPTNLAAPYATYAVTGNRAEKTLEGTVKGYDSSAVVTVTADTYESCQALMNAVSAALDDMSGSIGGITVEGSEVGDVADEPNGPVDVDGAQVYQGTIPVQIYYQ